MNSISWQGPRRPNFWPCLMLLFQERSWIPHKISTKQNLLIINMKIKISFSKVTFRTKTKHFGAFFQLTPVPFIVTESRELSRACENCQRWEQEVRELRRELETCRTRARESAQQANMANFQNQVLLDMVSPSEVRCKNTSALNVFCNEDIYSDSKHYVWMIPVQELAQKYEENPRNFQFPSDLKSHTCSH